MEHNVEERNIVLEEAADIPEQIWNAIEPKTTLWCNIKKGMGMNDKQIIERIVMTDRLEELKEKYNHLKYYDSSCVCDAIDEAARIAVEELGKANGLVALDNKVLDKIYSIFDVAEDTIKREIEYQHKKTKRSQGGKKYCLNELLRARRNVCLTLNHVGVRKIKENEFKSKLTGKMRQLADTIKD